MALCLLYALEVFGRERKDLEHFRQQTLKVGEMQEDGNILDCSLFSILIAFRASSNPSTSAPGCQAEKFEAKGSGHEAKMARAILFNERIVNWGTEVLN